MTSDGKWCHRHCDQKKQTFGRVDVEPTAWPLQGGIKKWRISQKATLSHSQDKRKIPNKRDSKGLVVKNDISEEEGGELRTNSTTDRQIHLWFTESGRSLSFLFWREGKKKRRKRGECMKKIRRVLTWGGGNEGDQFSQFIYGLSLICERNPTFEPRIWLPVLLGPFESDPTLKQHQHQRWRQNNLEHPPPTAAAHKLINPLPRRQNKTSNILFFPERWSVLFKVAPADVNRHDWQLTEQELVGRELDVTH